MMTASRNSVFRLALAQRSASGEAERPAQAGAKRTEAPRLIGKIEKEKREYW